MQSKDILRQEEKLSSAVGRGTFFGVLSNVAQILTRLVTVPIVIHHLGLDGYGIWNIIMMTATYMRFGSVGIKTAFQKYVAEATGTGEYDNANRLLSTGCIMMLALSVVGLIPVAIFSDDIAKAAGVPPNFLDSASGSISLLALIMGMSNVGAAFEATVMGGHRIDLLKKYGTALPVLEAIAIVTVMHLGYGLLAMSCIMGISELVYITICYFLSRRCVPEIVLSPKLFTVGVLYELLRFAGSYQLVNLLEVLYASLLPFAILRSFGANPAGVYAVVIRVVSCATVLLDAFLPPILSAGTMVYASGSCERMQALLAKAFKVTLVLSVFPLSFVALFGTTLAWAWTGETDPHFQVAFWLVSGRAVFASFSMLALVLYRVSGKALLDNVRQVLRILVIAATVVLAPRLGFYGVLLGMGVAEIVGMVFMLLALTHTFEVFRLRAVLHDAVRMALAAAIILGCGAMTSTIPLPGMITGRPFAALKLAEIGVGCLLVAWPTLVGTGAITADERNAVFDSLLPKWTHRRSAVASSSEQR